LLIKSNDVKIDLNGFAIDGKGAAGVGIYVPDAYQNIHIRNGVVRGWVQAGIDGSKVTGGRYIDVIASENGGDGLVIGANSMVVDCGSFDNGARGIVAGIGATVKNCKTRGNGSTGIVVNASSRISDCLAASNARAGIVLGASCTAKGCIATGNTTDGIVVSTRCRITGNNSTGNVKSGILIAGNGNIISGNSFSGNTTGITADTTTKKNLIIKNYANENTEQNYNVDPKDNSFGGFVSEPGAIPDTAGPWINFDLQQ